MKIVGYNKEFKEDLPPVKVDVWYFNEQKSWVVQLKDEENNQVGEADYIYYKKEALKRVEYYKKEYGIE